MTVSDFIQEKIKIEGPISFRDFMDMALYYPNAGYYTSPEKKIGKEGDYYTSPWLTPLFGEMLGKQVEEMWNSIGKGRFLIVEFGAGTGAQCTAILNYLQNFEDLFNNIEYCIIEKNTANLPPDFHTNKKIRLLNSITDLENFNGVIIANEVLDNFPVHQVVMEEELFEVFVDYKDGFFEIQKPASAELKNYFASLGVILPKGFRTEVNLEAINWLNDISKKIEKGFVLTIDYGNLSDDLYSAKRSKGTLLCYHRHRINDQPYNFIGDQDITAHVNFSALVYWGKQCGLLPVGYTDQSNFLLALGLTNHLRHIEIKMGNDPGSNKEDIFLLYKFLAEMGKKFRVLIQQKGMPDVKLASMQFGNKL